MEMGLEMLHLQFKMLLQFMTLLSREELYQFSHQLNLGIKTASLSFHRLELMDKLRIHLFRGKITKVCFFQVSYHIFIKNRLIIYLTQLNLKE